MLPIQRTYRYAFGRISMNTTATIMPATKPNSRPNMRALVLAELTTMPYACVCVCACVRDNNTEQGVRFLKEQ
eukprot:633099-Pelagomonas_calceolata.AAC.2